jgi:hypothetical protein
MYVFNSFEYTIPSLYRSVYYSTIIIVITIIILITIIIIALIPLSLPSQPLIQRATGVLSPVVKRPRREADHAPRPSVEVKKVWR